MQVLGIGAISAAVLALGSCAGSGKPPGEIANACVVNSQVLFRVEEWNKPTTYGADDVSWEPYQSGYIMRVVRTDPLNGFETNIAVLFRQAATPAKTAPYCDGYIEPALVDINGQQTPGFAYSIFQGDPAPLQHRTLPRSGPLRIAHGGVAADRSRTMTSDAQSKRIEMLERLARLRADGLLSEDEYAAEKAKLLSAEPDRPEPRQTAEGPSGDAPPAAQRPIAGSTPGVPAAEPNDNDLLAPIRPITDTAYAAFLVRKAWAGVAGLIAANALSAIPEIRESLSPRLGWAAPEPTPVAVVIAGALAGCLIVGLCGYWLARRRSRIAAVLLFIMAISVVVFGASLSWGDGIWVNLGVIALGLFSIWFFIGAWRGLTFISRSPNADEEAISITPAAKIVPASERLKAAWKEGRAQSRPVRHAIRWIGLAGLIIFVAGGVWLWVVTRDVAPDVRHETSPLPPVTAPQDTTVAPANAADVGAVQRDWFVGQWVEDWDTCGSGLGFTLTADGQYLSSEWTGSWTFDGQNIGWNRQCRPDAGCGNLEYMADGPGRAVILSADAFEQRFDGAATGTKFRRCL